MAPAQRPPQVTAANSNVCPECNATLAPTADVCPRCHAALGRPAQHKRTDADRLIDRPWLIVVLLLHLGVLGIPLYWSTRYSIGVRTLIVLASIVYTILAVLGIWWGIAQIIGMFRSL